MMSVIVCVVDHATGAEPDCDEVTGGQPQQQGTSLVTLLLAGRGGACYMVPL